MILDFFKTAANLKNVPRRGWADKLDHKNPESVAEHVYMTTIIGMILADSECLDTEKILKMILIHDLAESVTGDITPDQMEAKSKIKLEDTVMKKILKFLPEKLSTEYELLWDEFQQNLTKDAKLVHQIDKLEMSLQARIYLDDGFAPEKIAPFFDSAKSLITKSNIKKILTEIVRDKQ